MRRFGPAIALAVVIVIILVVVAAGCGQKATEPFNDASRGGSDNDGPARVIMMPDGFSNLATKCDHGNRIYVAYKHDDNRAAIAVSPHDKSCRGDRSVTDQP